MGLAAALTVGTGSLIGGQLHAAAGIGVPNPGPIITDVGGVPSVSPNPTIPPVPSVPAVPTVYTLTLSASSSNAPSGAVVTLTAAALPTVPSGYHIDIWELTSLTPPHADNSTYCYWTPCSASYAQTSGEYWYQAFLDNGVPPASNYPPAATSILATTAPVAVGWGGLPSAQYCDIPILGGADAGFSHDVDVRTEASETDVCFRIDNHAGVVVGGALRIVGSPTVGLPTTLAGNQCRDAQGNNLAGNNIAGPHPLINPMVLGQEFYVDTYRGPASNGDLWVCISAPGVADTVDFFSTGTAVPTVSFVPDPDSLV